VLEFTVGTGGEGAGSAQFTQATPDAIRSFIAIGFLEMGIRGRSIDYRFVDQTGHVRDQVRQSVPGMPAG
jgi:hypothetical protein